MLFEVLKYNLTSPVGVFKGRTGPNKGKQKYCAHDIK